MYVAMVHVRGHGACTWPWCMYVAMVHVRGHMVHVRGHDVKLIHHLTPCACAHVSPAWSSVGIGMVRVFMVKLFIFGVKENFCTFRQYLRSSY